MTPLRKQMLEDMVLRGLSKATQQAYVHAVAGLAKYYRRSKIFSQLLIGFPIT